MKTAGELINRAIQPEQSKQATNSGNATDSNRSQINPETANLVDLLFHTLAATYGAKFTLASDKFARDIWARHFEINEITREDLIGVMQALPRMWANFPPDATQVIGFCKLHKKAAHRPYDTRQLMSPKSDPTKGQPVFNELRGSLRRSIAKDRKEAEDDQEGPSRLPTMDPERKKLMDEFIKNRNRKNLSQAQTETSNG